ncbi:MAG: Rrf2 family transcriptional regulator [Deltaproteobacteria bacterium]|nr:Rrf2 family transcriptional regulator [Deltaproteobacteria bacterium]
MLQLNRKTEYALLSLEHIARKGGDSERVSNTREISEAHHIPYPILGKVLQKMASKGLIKSVQGINGGYVLARKPEDLSVMDIIQIFDGKFAVVGCFKEGRCDCPQWKGCHIKDPLSELNHKIYRLIAQTKLSDLLSPPEKIERRSA